MLTNFNSKSPTVRHNPRPVVIRSVREINQLQPCALKAIFMSNKVPTRISMSLSSMLKIEKPKRIGKIWKDWVYGINIPDQRGWEDKLLILTTAIAVTSQGCNLKNHAGSKITNSVFTMTQIEFGKIQHDVWANQESILICQGSQFTHGQPSVFMSTLAIWTLTATFIDDLS